MRALAIALSMAAMTNAAVEEESLLQSKMVDTSDENTYSYEWYSSCSSGIFTKSFCQHTVDCQDRSNCCMSEWKECENPWLGWVPRTSNSNSNNQASNSNNQAAQAVTCQAPTLVPIPVPHGSRHSSPCTDHTDCTADDVQNPGNDPVYNVGPNGLALYCGGGGSGTKTCRETKPHCDACIGDMQCHSRKCVGGECKAPIRAFASAPKWGWTDSSVVAPGAALAAALAGSNYGNPCSQHSDCTADTVQMFHDPIGNVGPNGRRVYCGGGGSSTKTCRETKDVGANCQGDMMCHYRHCSGGKCAAAWWTSS